MDRRGSVRAAPLRGPPGLARVRREDGTHSTAGATLFCLQLYYVLRSGFL